MSGLADRIGVLRDEVLVTVEHGDRDPPGAEVFDAIVRALAAFEPGDTGNSEPIDLTLHDALARRLAWGDGEDQLLGDAAEVFDRLIKACGRALRDPDEQIAVIEAAGEVLTAMARIVALAAVERTARDRAARTREELAQRRLREALARQKEELERVRREYNG
jgi:hypothetical protein